MDIRQLECFVTSVESGSFTKASELLYMNQSNVSRMVKKLEIELDTNLFIRNGKKIFLTMEGENVYQKSKEILFRLKHLGSCIEQKKYDTFSIATFPSNYIAYAYSKLCHFHFDDSVIFEIFSRGTSEILKLLEEHTADIGIIYSSEYQSGRLQHVLDKRKLEFFPLCRALPTVYIGKKNPLCHEKKLTTSQLQQLRFIKVDYDYKENYHDLIGTVHMYELENQLRNAVVIDDGYGMTQLLNHTEFCYLGHTWMNNELTSEIMNPNDSTIYSNSVILESADGEISMGYVLRKDEEPSAYVQEFLDVIKEELLILSDIMQ